MLVNNEEDHDDDDDNDSYDFDDVNEDKLYCIVLYYI